MVVWCLCRKGGFLGCSSSVVGVPRLHFLCWRLPVEEWYVKESLNCGCRPDVRSYFGGQVEPLDFLLFHRVKAWRCDGYARPGDALFQAVLSVDHAPSCGDVLQVVRARHDGG